MIISEIIIKILNWFNPLLRSFFELFFTFGLLLRQTNENGVFMMSFEMKNIHVGNMIQTELKKQGRSVNWLAEQIYCEKSNVYKMFKRKSIDLEQLMLVSTVLKHNFLRDCYEEKA